MADVHPAVGRIAWLLGQWEGQGEGFYPTITSFKYIEEIEFRTSGTPVLAYSSRTWNASRSKAMHSENGFLKANASTPAQLALSLAMNTGLAEMAEGNVSEDGRTITLSSTSVGRPSFGKEPKVEKIERRYHLRDNNTLEYTINMQTSRTEMQPHLTATLSRR